MENNQSNTDNPFFQLLKNPLVLENLTVKLGFQKPTPIQEAVIPAVLLGKDVYAGAKTGSGKTIAFLAPISEMLLEGKIKKALVLCPTRELALQIDEEAMKILEGQTRIVPIPLYGGVPMDQQMRAFKTHKPSLYIATPGRMIDFIMDGTLDLTEIEACILDEADRMCDMGFAPQVNQILDALTCKKQSLMFSATLPKEVNAIMGNFLKDPVRIQVDDPNTSSSTIEHRAILCNRRDKVERLFDLLNAPNEVSVVFVRTRKTADRLYSDLNRQVSDLGILHAGYSMGDRERTIRAFKEGKLRNLIATDVASRGLDVDQITRVIHFELPEGVDDYIHRSGRAGRAGRAGVSIALVDRDNLNQRRQIQEIGKKIKIEFEPGRELPTREPNEDLSPSRPQQSRESSRNRSPRRREASGDRDRSRDRSRGGRTRSDRADRVQPSQKAAPTSSRKAPSAETGTRKTPAAKKSSTGIVEKARKFFKKIFD